MRFNIPTIDIFSFITGFIVAGLSWWVVSLLRPIFQHLRSDTQIKQPGKEENDPISNGVEERYRKNLLLQAQGMHLAAPLFSLDEIIQPPVLLAPPVRVEPGKPFQSENIIENAIPYMPAWPELAAIYNAPTLTFAQALSGDSDIVLTGKPGAGKTVALAYLASRLSRHEPEPYLPQDIVPFLIHVADLDLPFKKNEPLNPLIALIAENSPVFDRPKIPDFIHRTITEGRALLMLDGTDELTPEGLKTVVEFIKAIKRTHPKIRMITTASCEFTDGLVTLNFIPFTLASWKINQCREFIENWSNLWEQHVPNEAGIHSGEFVDPLLLTNWLAAGNQDLSPLELTLKVWGSFAGDVLGSSPIDAIESHLRRLSPENIPNEALEMLAAQVSLSAEPIFDIHIAGEWIKTFEPTEIPEGIEANRINNGKDSVGERIPTFGLITKMVESGLLVKHRNNRLRFIHPIFCGFLAGKGLAKYKPEILLDQAPCIGKSLALNYFSAFGDATSIVENLLSGLDRPLSRNLLYTARWLRDGSPQMSWRTQVMTSLVGLLRQKGQPLGLRGQALCALIQSRDPSVPVLLRQLLEDPDYDMLLLASLGSGALQDIKAIESLSALTSAHNPRVCAAACLALVNIGTIGALDIVASVLLHGDENQRRAAAVALANHPKEGHAMLKEGAQLKEDLLVRRASAFGLGCISESWAEEIINHLELEDDQWAVRNAAMEVNENRRQPNRHIPQRLPPPAESPWIIAFAGKQGLGVSPDKIPTDLLILALKSGTDEERFASLAYLRMMPLEGVFGVLFHAMYGSEQSLREAVFQTLNEMSARGVVVPDPVQYGVGY